MDDPQEHVADVLKDYDIFRVFHRNHDPNVDFISSELTCNLRPIMHENSGIIVVHKSDLRILTIYSPLAGGSYVRES